MTRKQVLNELVELVAFLVLAFGGAWLIMNVGR